MVPFISLKDLYRDTFRRSTLISIPNLSDLLEVPGSEFTKWETFYGIVKDAVQKYSYYYPLVLVQKMFINVDSTSRKAYINDTFENYVKGICDEDTAIVMPSSVQGLSYNAYVGATYPLRNFRYNTGVFYDFWYSTGIYYANTTAIFPLYEEYVESSKEPTSRCGLYYMPNKDSAYSVFRDELYCQVCRYLMNIKKNMNLPNMPIELFQGLEEDYNNVSSKLETLYSTALLHSNWLI